MAWRDLTSEEREAEIKAQGKWLPPGSGLEEQFGIKWDKAADDGAPFELDGRADVRSATARDAARGVFGAASGEERRRFPRLPGERAASPAGGGRDPARPSQSRAAGR